MSTELSVIDQRLLRYAAHKSPTESSEILNGTVTPAEVASRVQTLLRSRNWLTTLQRKQLLADRLYELLDAYWEWALQGSIKSTDVVFKSIKELRQLLEEDRVSIDQAMTLITESHAERMGQAVALSFRRLLEILVERNVGVSDEDVEPILRQVLAPAMEEIDQGVQHD